MTFQQLSKAKPSSLEEVASSVPSPWEDSGLSAEQYIEKVTQELRGIDFHRQTDLSTVKSAISNAVQVITYCQLRVEVERASMMIKALDKEGIYGRGQADTGSSDQGVIQGDNSDRSLEQDSFGHRNVMEQGGRDK